MATINFSVPEDVKREFQETFAGENRSAVIADLMRRAVAERRRLQQRAEAIDRLLELRQRLPPASAEQISRARRAGRP
jgi:metal-responsive CopG/Arc/MetJ family transcriptional regulator